MPIKSNFLFLQEHDELLARLGLQAERYFASDPFGEKCGEVGACRVECGLK